MELVTLSGTLPRQLRPRLTPQLAAPPPAPPPGPPYDPEDPHGTACVDARNGFGELSRKAMLWTVRHLWALGARFAFNCYRHASLLVIRRMEDGISLCDILLSMEGVTQGDPLAMALYGLALVPLAIFLRQAVPSVIQPWYADDAAMAGPVSGIKTAMRILLEMGPKRGYFPKPAKSIFVGRPADSEKAKEVLAEFNFRHLDGTRYLGGFIGTKDTQDAWLQPKIQKWVEAVQILARVARRYPQTAYAGLTRSLQTEWTYLQRVVPGISEAFAPVEQALAKDFLPALLGDKPDGEAHALREISCFPVWFAGMGIPNPVDNAERHYLSSSSMTEPVSSSLRAGAPLDAMGYGNEAKKIQRESKTHREMELEAALEPLTAAAPPSAARRMKRSTTTGAWLTAMPDVLNGTELSSDEFRDSLRLRHGLQPQRLPSRCDGCHQRFTVGHALQC